MQLTHTKPLLILGISLLLMVPAGTVLGQGANNTTGENQSQDNASAGNQSQNESANQSDENDTGEDNRTFNESEDNETNESEDNETFRNESTGNASDENASDENETGEDKVEICHVPPGNPDERHTIHVGAPAVEAHMGHGDERGACEEGTESEQVEQASAQGEIGSQVQIDSDGQGTQESQGDVQVTDVSVDGDTVTFAVQPASDECTRDTVVRFDVDKVHFEGEAEGDITVGMIPSAGAQTAGNDTNETNETNDTNESGEANESNETNASEDDGFFDDENESEEANESNETNETNETNDSEDDGLFGNGSTEDTNASEETVNETEVEVTVETKTQVNIEKSQARLVHDLDKVVESDETDASASTEIGSGTDGNGSSGIGEQTTSTESEVTYMVVQDDDVVHVIMNLGEVCDTQEGQIVTTQSAGTADGEVEVPGPGFATVALAIAGTALAVAYRRD